MRDVELTLTGTCSVDALKALLGGIEALEKRYLYDPTSVADVTAVPAVFTGTTHRFAYTFTFTTAIATGEYTAVFVSKQGTINPQDRPSFARSAPELETFELPDDAGKKLVDDETNTLVVKGEVLVDEKPKGKKA